MQHFVEIFVYTIDAIIFAFVVALLKKCKSSKPPKKIYNRQKVEALEHFVLEERPWREWNHSSVCRECKLAEQVEREMAIAKAINEKSRNSSIQPVKQNNQKAVAHEANGDELDNPKPVRVNSENSNFPKLGRDIRCSDCAEVRDFSGRTHYYCCTGICKEVFS